MREEENKRSSQSKVKSIMKKRWFLPAVYIFSAAVLLTGILVYQASDNEFTQDPSENKQNITSENNEPSIEVNNSLETFTIPMSEAESAVIKKEFYDVDGDTKQQEASLVVYNNTYQPNTGIDYAMKDGKGFDVTASMSGKVKSVQEDALLGNLVVVEHDKGIETHYSSIKDIKVKEGDNLKQGETFAKGGTSAINEEAGTHVHFEVRKDNVAVNPLEYLDKPISSLKAEKKEADTKAKDSADQEKEETTENQDDAGNETSEDSNENQESNPNQEPGNE
ncbi:M23 family metallopeptidase [Pradoshia sp. D12]|nr:M23 family metallopeptidase [Bacillus sp. D12]QFK72969.1 M23 family metallopeptidase [Pradoshia sp. D12]TPF71961.1 M23 family metallopeptidase [Bacillus sp. D12]